MGSLVACVVAVARARVPSGCEEDEALAAAGVRARFGAIAGAREGETSERVPDKL